MLPPIRNARIYWRPNRGPEDPGGFYPVCLELECNTINAWSAEEAKPTGEAAYHSLVLHRKQTHKKDNESPGLLPKEEQPRYLYNPADTEPGALA